MHLLQYCLVQQMSGLRLNGQVIRLKLLHLSGIESCGAGLGEHGTMLLRRVCMLGNFDVHLLQ